MSIQIIMSATTDSMLKIAAYRDKTNEISPILASRKS